MATDNQTPSTNAALVPEGGRRDFLMTSLATGFALAVQPVSSQTG